MVPKIIQSPIIDSFQECSSFCRDTKFVSLFRSDCPEYTKKIFSYHFSSRLVFSLRLIICEANLGRRGEGGAGRAQPHRSTTSGHLCYLLMRAWLAWERKAPTKKEEGAKWVVKWPLHNESSLLNKFQIPV